MPFESTFLYDKDGKIITPITLVENIADDIEHVGEPADIAPLKTCFENRDDADPTAFEDVEEMVSGETNSELFSKISATVKNTRFLNKEFEKKVNLYTGDTAPTDGSELWLDTSQEETYNIPEIDDEMVSDVDTWSSQKINTELNKKMNFYTGDTEPMDGSKVWLNPDGEDVLDVPEIRDTTVSAIDTWSSKKIKEELEKVQVGEGIGGGGDCFHSGDEQPTNGEAIWLDTSEEVIFDMPEINDSAVSTTDTWSSSKINEELDKKMSVHKGSEAPTDGSELWLDTETGETYEIPEIKDTETNETDTWSSSKISEELNKKPVINDDEISETDTWSSSKIISVLNEQIAKLEQMILSGTMLYGLTDENGDSLTTEDGSVLLGQEQICKY